MTKIQLSYQKEQTQIERMIKLREQYLLPLLKQLDELTLVLIKLDNTDFNRKSKEEIYNIFSNSYESMKKFRPSLEQIQARIVDKKLNNCLNLIQLFFLNYEFQAAGLDQEISMSSYDKFVQKVDSERKTIVKDLRDSLRDATQRVYYLLSGKDD